MRKILSLIVLCILSWQIAYAQNYTVSGVVTSSDDGSPMPGVSVVVKGTTTGITTDIDGNYSIVLPDGKRVLVFSFVGMKTQEITIKDNSPLNVVLDLDTKAIDEVMVVAYGTTKKTSFTGSATSVKADDIKNVPVTSFEKALTGLVSGVQVSNTSGQPGSTTSVRIRGRGSYSASSSPLYVIDGIPMTTSSDTYSGNLLSSLNPGDIKTLTVLKDAAAASLYGSLAANGVILITTKGGEKGKAKFNISHATGFSTFATDNLETASGEDFVRTHTDAMRNAGYDDDEIAEELADEEYATPVDGKYIDWKDLLFRTGVTNNTEVSASGGDDKTTFYLSANVFDQKGVSRASQLTRNSGRANITHEYSDKLKFGVNIMLAETEQQAVSGGNTWTNPFYNYARKSWPTVSPYYADGSLRRELKGGDTFNFLDLSERSSRVGKIFRSMTSGWAELKITKGLTAKTTAMYDWINSDQKNYSSPESATGIDEGGIVYKSNTRRKNFTSSTTVVYDYTFADAHNINLLGGYEVSKLDKDNLFAEGNGLPNETLKSLGVTTVMAAMGGNSSTKSMISYFSRLNYDYKNRYYFSGSFRRDGSSKLGKNERWANFYSLSASWRLSEEGFLQDIEAVDNLKIRASYGTSGNLPGGYYDHLSLYGYGKYNEQSAAVEIQFGNDNLTWEKNKNFNVGLEFGLFSRISASVDYFKRVTSDLLLSRDISTITGFSSIDQNLGEMENSGIEVELNTQNLTEGELKWNTTFSFSMLNNKITKLPYVETDSRTIKKKGLPYYAFYLLPWAGVDPENGDPLWYKVNVDEQTGNKSINYEETTNNYKDTEQVEMGTPDPDFFGSIGNNFSYKGFDLSFMFNFSVGGKLYHRYATNLWNDGYKSYKYALPVTQTDYWTPDNPNSKNPKPIWKKGNKKSYKHSSRFLMDNDFLRLKNISLSYNLPSSVTESLHLGSVRLYVQGTNLLTFSSQDLVDPEQSPSGLISFQMPNSKTVTFGISVGF